MIDRYLLQPQREYHLDEHMREEEVDRGRRERRRKEGGEGGVGWRTAGDDIFDLEAQLGVTILQLRPGKE